MATALDSMLVRTPGTCGGQLRIDGTRITVNQIAVMFKKGLSAEDIVSSYRHLSLGQVYAALPYYLANRAEIDAELAEEDRLYDVLKQAEAERRAKAISADK
jgi:uncharacterized protein (DUF433 family)